MRTLEKNKFKIWYSNIASTTEQLDVNGHYTGVKINVYSTPVVAYLALYPANGKITNQLFGKDAVLDMVAVTTDVVLGKDTLVFTVTPVEPYYDNCDYIVDMINESLNCTSYGLKRNL